MAVPLRKLQKDGTLYQRRPEIESKLDALLLSSRSDVGARCKIDDPDDADHIPSECLLHLVRGCRTDNSDRHFEALFVVLRRRVIGRLPAPEIGRGPDGEVLTSQRNVKIAEYVLDRFQALLVTDRAAYDERLDYFEVNFDAAIASLRLDARRKAFKEEKRSEPMTYDDETSELNAEIEEAAAAQNPLSASKLDEPAYRSRLYAAIDALPEDQRRVIELLLLGIPMDSKDSGVRSIAQILECVEKTVRNRRDRAYVALRKALEEDAA
jgi:hypothetical protein